MTVIPINFALSIFLAVLLLAACGNGTSTPRLAQTLGTEEPEATAPAGEFVPVSIGGFDNCGVRGDGSVECWRRDGTDKGPE